MDLRTYNGEPVADTGKFIRLTLRGHYVRWRLEKELASSSSLCAAPLPERDRRPAVSCGRVGRPALPAARPS